MSGISVLAANLKLLGQLTFGKNLTAFPLNPQVGDWCLKDFMVFAYVTFDGIDTWMPFSKTPRGYVHRQPIASLNWTVSHNLGTDDIFYQIKDLEDNIVSVGIAKVNDNQFTIAFSEATAGSVVVLALDVPVNTGGGGGGGNASFTYEAPVAALTHVVPHALGKAYPTVTVYDMITGMVVLADVKSDNINQITVTCSPASKLAVTVA